MLFIMSEITPEKENQRSEAITENVVSETLSKTKDLKTPVKSTGENKTTDSNIDRFGDDNSSKTPSEIDLGLPDKSSDENKTPERECVGDEVVNKTPRKTNLETPENSRNENKTPESKADSFGDENLNKTPSKARLGTSDNLRSENKTSESETERFESLKKSQAEFKTPVKTTPENNTSGTTTPEKSESKDETPKKSNNQISFKTPVKSPYNNKLDRREVCNGNKINNGYHTPEKKNDFLDVQSGQKLENDSFVQNDGEEGMISTTEQARLLIAASRTPSKGNDRTPSKQNTPSRKRCIENSPGTPGKFRRVELITLSSPKMKKIKEM